MYGGSLWLCGALYNYPETKESTSGLDITHRGIEAVYKICALFLASSKLEAEVNNYLLKDN